MIREGNLPLLFRPGPSSLGICLITASEARKPAYFFAARHRPSLRQAAPLAVLQTPAQAAHRAS